MIHAFIIHKTFRVSHGYIPGKMQTRHAGHMLGYKIFVHINQAMDISVS
jgi:hypothetical protein